MQVSIESRSRQYGKVFDHWQIREFLGSGSGGKTAVFRLVRSDSSRGVSALKVINLIEVRGEISSLSGFRREEYETAREECSRNAEQEVWLMDDLRGNTNIVDYLDHTFVDWSDETGFGRDLLIRMEYLKDLRGELHSGRVFTEAQALKIGSDICTALIRCHRKNILHRDVKPENIFRNKDGDYKLGDFGVSRVLDACPGAVASTGIGTYEYWPAEQMTGRYDKRVDIYSLGLVLYELCNRNRLPFASSTYVTGREVSFRLAGTPLPAPADASPALAGVILKACAFDPEDRYQSAEEFLRALHQVQKGQEEPDSEARRKSDYATQLAQPSAARVPADSDETAPEAEGKHREWPVFPAQILQKKTYTSNRSGKYSPREDSESEKRFPESQSDRILLGVGFLILFIAVMAASYLFAQVIYGSRLSTEEAGLATQTVDAAALLAELPKPTVQTTEPKAVTEAAAPETTEPTEQTQAPSEDATQPDESGKLAAGSWGNGDLTVTALDDSTLRIEVTDQRWGQQIGEEGSLWSVHLNFGKELTITHPDGSYAISWPYRCVLSSLAYRKLNIQDYEQGGKKYSASEDNLKNLWLCNTIKDGNNGFYPLNELHVDCLEIVRKDDTYTAEIVLPDWFAVSAYDLTAAEITLYNKDYFEQMRENGRAGVELHPARIYP